MTTDIKAPQFPESIAEGTVSKWLKQVGDTVERDEPILEISTDKVDAEIPAPASGTLVEVVVAEGATVEVGTVVAFMATSPAALATSRSTPASNSCHLRYTPTDPGKPSKAPDSMRCTSFMGSPAAGMQ